MSFGFSAGDFMAGAKLSYTLGKAVSDSHGASKQYQELITELHVVHKVMLQVQELHEAKQIPIATANALLFTVNATNGVMETFLDEHERYGASLRPGGSGNSAKGVYKKGSWATTMPKKVVELRNSLATMLAALNCLLSLACYYKTGYDPRCSADLSPKIDHSPSMRFHHNCPWRDVKLEAYLSVGSGNKTLGYESQNDPASFFRPGQIFAAQITSNFSSSNEREFRRVRFGNLPLGSIPNLEAQAESEGVADRAKSLAQIRRLPLKQMTRYCRDLPGNRGEVVCHLCSNYFVDTYPRDLWATHHFRIHHWKQYFGILLTIPHVAGLLQKEFQQHSKIIPWNKQELPPRASGTQFLAEEWIDLENVTNDTPISTDEEIIARIDGSSIEYHCQAGPGPVMIQRFVVVRQGDESCLCIGIHTYARRGCGGQPDQEMFGIISPAKGQPQAQPDETGIRLKLVRMRPDHPSTALPSTARIHYGRAYEIDHYVPVQSLGLIHSSSMEILIDQFEASVLKSDPEESLIQYEAPYQADRGHLKPGEGVQAADMNIVKDIREQITKVLGTKISPLDHKPPQRPPLAH